MSACEFEQPHQQKGSELTKFTNPAAHCFPQLFTLAVTLYTLAVTLYTLAVTLYTLAVTLYTTQ